MADNNQFSAPQKTEPIADQEVEVGAIDNAKKEKKDVFLNAQNEFDEENDDAMSEPVNKPPRKGIRLVLYKMQRCFEYMIPPGGYVASAFTLGSATLGTGILGLPAAFNSMGLITSILILLVIVIFTIFSLGLMARCADATGLRTYAEIAQAILGFGPSVFISIMLVVFCLGTDISYVISIGNLLTPIFDDDAVPSYLRTQSGNRLIVSMIWLVIIYPLCLLKSIDSLRHVSTLAVLAVAFFCVCIIVNCGQYWHEHGWNDTVHFFNTGNNAIVGLGSLLFACLVQMNAFEIYHQMNNPSPRRMIMVSCLGLGTCGCFYFASGIFGYCRFGEKVIDSILLEYQPREDKEMWVSYFGMVVKLCVGFILHQIPIRDSFYHYMGWDVYRMKWWKNCFFCTIFSVVVLIAGLFIPSITIVLGLTGSLCGGFVGLIYPPMMIMYIGNWSLKTAGIMEFIAMYILIIIGVVAIVFGTIASIYGVI